MKTIKVLAAKAGLDGHDRGIKVLCHALRDAGMEVVYIGLKQTPQQIANTALQENVDFVALSILSGAHNYVLPEIAKLFKEKRVEIPIIAGGLIPEEDIGYLLKSGIKKVFEPNVSTKEVIQYLTERYSEK